MNKMHRAWAALRERPHLIDYLLAEDNLGRQVTSPDMLADIVRAHIPDNEREYLVAVAFDGRRAVIDAGVVTSGSLGFTIVDPATILRWALTRERPAASIAVAHNHPSGDPTPSGPDVDVTRRLEEACRCVNVPLVDHLVLGSRSYTSLYERGHISHKSATPFTNT